MWIPAPRSLRILALVLTGLALVLATYLLLFPNKPGGVSRINDKLAHVIVFVGLALPGLVAGWPDRRVLVAGLAVYGGVIELVQPHTGRTAEWLDLVANLAGIAVALGLAGGIHQALRWRGRRRRVQTE